MTAALAQPGLVDAGRFAALVQRHRGELFVHCVRMLRSPERAEDALQEALLRAWRARSGYAARASVRAWLYRIATNTCLDEIRRDRNRPLGLPVARATPFEAEGQLPALASSDPGPDVLVEARESLERAMLAVIELLPPRQRAVLILGEVLRCSAAETAQLLDMSVPAVNSARQRARATLGGDHRPRAGRRRSEVRAGSADRKLLDRYVDAMRGPAVPTLVALARADANHALDAGPEPGRGQSGM